MTAHLAARANVVSLCWRTLRQQYGHCHRLVQGVYSLSSSISETRSQCHKLSSCPDAEALGWHQFSEVSTQQEQHVVVAGGWWMVCVCMCMCMCVYECVSIHYLCACGFECRQKEREERASRSTEHYVRFKADSKLFFLKKKTLNLGNDFTLYRALCTRFKAVFFF